MKHAPKLATPSERRQVDRTHPALVMLSPEAGVAAPTRALATLLAQALAREFGDAAIVVHLAEHAIPEESWHAISGPPSLSPSTSIAGPHSRAGRIETDAGHADHLELPVPADPRGAAEVLLDRLRPLFLRYAYVFIDASARGAVFGRRLEDEISMSDIHGVVRRLVVLGRDDDGLHGDPGPRSRPSAMRPVSRRYGPTGFTLPPPPPWSILRTRILPPHPPEHMPPAPLSPEGVRAHLAAARRLAGRMVDRLGGSAVEPSGEPYPGERVVPERCRVRLDLDALARLDEPLLARLPGATRSSFARWARALTWRRVGVALGGSGAWGYAHVALLQELEDRGIPIDLIGGSSSGALMGAYYSVLGRSGLDLAVERGPRFERLALVSTITSTVIDLGVEADLGEALLEDLEILLLPVATNLSHARAEVITKSTVASAVRASASAPGVFASTITRAGLYVDGAVTDNVPVVLVERMGADLLVACNPLPPPPSVRVRTPTTPLSDFLAELNPINRLRDLLVSFELMFHDFGDCEAAETRIVYEPPPEAGPLFRTFNYGKSRELVDEVKREDSFRATLQRSADAWAKLAGPRAG
ncbi:MAG: patatin-like phospholipase family protein [Minicystis sp.]